jgi:acetyltransferase-like isoleucine patch superfamily enzyme
MSDLGAISRRAGAVRREARRRAWVAATRARLAAHGCSLEVVAGRGAGFSSLPHVVATRQRGVGELPGRSGRLRVELGEDVDLGWSTMIEIVPSADNELVLGRGMTIAAGVRFVLFGGSIQVGEWSRIGDHATLKSSGSLGIGARAIVGAGGMIHCASQVTLADRVGLGERVSILDSDHQPDGTDVYLMDQPMAVEPVSVGANAWIGVNSVLLRGTQLGRNCVVAAGSVVRRGDYPAGQLVAGSPASAVKALGS